jgi:predicted component of type VI protein secretion system
MKIIRRFLENRFPQLRARRIKRDQLEHYKDQYELNLQLEQWISKRIRDGNVDRRKELSEMQAKIKEIKLFLNYYENL